MLTFESAQSLGVGGILEKLTVSHGQQAQQAASGWVGEGRAKRG